MTIPRNEYPRPQFVRNDWLNLNGEWDFEFDFGRTGIERKIYEQLEFSKKIIVPFCPESKLSGIEYKDFMAGVWYRRTFSLPDTWQNRRTFINFGAADYKTVVFVGGKLVGEHFGGYSSFSFEITDYVSCGENTVAVYCEDDSRNLSTPSGKQSRIFASNGCDYTRTTGIWQTVWLESTPKDYIKSAKITPCLKSKSVDISLDVSAQNTDACTAQVSFNGKIVAEKTVPIIWNTANFFIELTDIHPWSIETPDLYDVTFTLGSDTVKSYFGLRDITLQENKLYLNGKPVFGRYILDQGFYPDGIYTAPSDDELVADIKRSQAMGFNGARLHQKVFEERFLYHCDRLGYIVWGEHANWGLDTASQTAYEGFLPEWIEIIKRDYNHPSIIGWCPLNETQVDINPRFVKCLYSLTKAFDSTRLFIDNSGWVHIDGCYDVFDVHDYLGDPKKFREKYEPLQNGEAVECLAALLPDTVHEAQPKLWRNDISFISEFGGMALKTGDDAWGYGDSPETKEEFIKRYDGLVTALLENPKITAFCYTQLTDVEQEQNGLYTYDRKPKIDPEIIYKITAKKSVIEK